MISVPFIDIILSPVSHTPAMLIARRELISPDLYPLFVTVLMFGICNYNFSLNSKDYIFEHSDFVPSLLFYP